MQEDGIIKKSRVKRVLPVDGRSSPASAAKAARIDLKERDANMEANLEPKNELIACCGLDCETCDARIATITNNDALREKTAALWTKLNAVAITPDMIYCTGCRVEGAKTPFCDKLCPVHNCVREKGLDTCADCGQMDGCQTLGRIAANSPFVLENLRKLRCKEPLERNDA